jgi:hypothetical protein
VRDAQIRDGRRTIVSVGWPVGKGQPMALSDDASQHTVHESSGARLARQTGEVHRLVDGGRGRNAIEVQHLIQAETQDCDDLGVHLRQRAAGEMFDQEVEAALPAYRAGDDLHRQPTIALVVEIGAAAGECGREIDVARVDGPQDAERRRTGFRHGACGHARS